MITVKKNNQTATIDRDFVTGGDEPLATMIEIEIMDIKPDESQAGNPFAFLFYELEKRGWNVQADDGDLDDIDIPDDAVS